MTTLARDEDDAEQEFTNIVDISTTPLIKLADSSNETIAYSLANLLEGLVDHAEPTACGGDAPG